MLARDFVCARVVHMGDVDLDLFQFDYDMTWAAFFMNADLTIYGRYGSRNAVGQGSNALISLSSLKQAMERALEIHKNRSSTRRSCSPTSRSGSTRTPRTPGSRSTSRMAAA
ncbi:MAG: hypothetical protein ACYTDU_18445 [Planctomycetota bacterium]